MTVIFLSGSYLTMKMARGLGWGPLAPLPFSGETYFGYVTLWQKGREEGRGSQERFWGQ